MQNNNFIEVSYLQNYNLNTGLTETVNTFDSCYILCKQRTPRSGCVLVCSQDVMFVNVLCIQCIERLSGKQRLWSDCANAQADQTLG